MERSVERLRHALRPSDNTGEPADAAPFQARFQSAMDEDLNTSQAIAALFDLAREINRARDTGGNINAAQDTLRQLGSVLGLNFQEVKKSTEEHLAATPFIELLVETRQELRKAKQFALADQIRDGLAKQGVVMEDTPQGTEWQYQPGDH